MADNNILSKLQDLLKNTPLNDLIKQAEGAMADEKNGAAVTDEAKPAAQGGGLKNLLKVLNMLKSFQGGKIFGNLGKISGLSSLKAAAQKFQDSPEDTESQETKLDELDTMVAMVLEDGVITPEEEEMLSKKAEELGVNVQEFLAEVREKCAEKA